MDLLYSVGRAVDSVFIAGKFDSKEKYCSYIVDTPYTPGVALELRKNFGDPKLGQPGSYIGNMGEERFREQCLFFHRQDCQQFNPINAGITDFAKKAYKFYEAIVDAGKCIGEKLSDPNNKSIDIAKQQLMKYFTGNAAGDFIKGAMGAVLGVVANIMTAGVWGGLKGAYYLVKLGFQIKR